MRTVRALIRAALVVAFLSVGPVGVASVAGASNQSSASQSWVVMLRPGSDAAQAAPGLARSAGGTVGLVYRTAISGFQFRGSAAAAAALRQNPNVVSVAVDHALSLTESLPNGIERISAYDNDNTAASAWHAGFRGNGARIAVMDTGIDLDHPDLVNAIDQGLGYNCVTPGAPPNDGYGHGTHVAGTAAAPLNGVGVVGVAAEARLVAFKVFDDAGNSSESLVLCGFEHAIALNTDADPTNDVDVLNMSFGEDRTWGDCATDALHAAVCNAAAAGIIMVAGAGNSAASANSFVPAAFDEVISVSALADFDATPGGLAGCGLVPDLFLIDCDDTFAVFSNFGTSVDVIAPGVSVYSTYKDAGYLTSSGTSMATPHVAGVAALIAAQDHALTASAVRAIIRQSGECPNGSVAGADGDCVGQGLWADDPDGIAEPMANALRAAQSLGGVEPVIPGAPTLTGATAGNTTVALNWAPPATDGGSALTGYQLYRGPSAAALAPLTTVGVTTGYTDTGLTNGTTYWYAVAAINAVGTGGASNTLAATPALPVTVVARTGGAVSTFASASSASGAITFSLPAGSNRLVAAVSLNSTTTRVSSITWKPDPANPAADQALVFVGRQVAPANGAVEIWDLADPTPGVAGSTVAHLLTGNAKRVMGLAALSGVGSRGTPVGSGVNATSIGVTVPSATNGLVVDVLYGLNSTAAYTAGAGQTERWDTGTTGGTANLRGCGSTEAGAASVAMTWTIGATTNVALLAVSYETGSGSPPTVPGAPTLTAATAGDGVVALTWSPPASNGGSPITGYQILRGASSGGESLLTTVGAGTTFTDTAVANGATYWYRVAAINAVGTGSASNELAATPEAAAVIPGAPTLTGATAGNTTVALNWAPPATDGGSALTGYQLYRGPSAAALAPLTTVGVTTGYTDTGLTNGTTYWYAVAAINAVGTGGASNTLAATPALPVTVVARTGGAVSTFASASSASGAITFSLPAGSNRLVAAVSLNSTTTRVSSITWKPDPANPAADQALVFVGRQVAPANGAVEIWDLADPTPGVAGSTVAHLLTGNAKRVMGLAALSGVGSRGTPVGSGVNATSIGVTVPSATNGLVVDVLYGLNSTAAYTAGAGQTERWDTGTTGGTANLRGCGSTEAGAASVAMTWTIGGKTKLALLAVSYNPA